MLGPLLFNIHLHDLFYQPDFTEVCNFADDTTFRACDNDLNILIMRLEDDALLAIQWFENSNMKLNKDKCHILLSEHKPENVLVKWGKKKFEKVQNNNHLGWKLEEI